MLGIRSSRAALSLSVSSGLGILGALASRASMSSFASGGAQPQVSHDPATKTITVQPGGGEYDSVVVLMHGLGDSAMGFADVAQMFVPQLDGVKFVLPTAPAAPVTMNGGFKMNSWYDIAGLTDRASENCEGIEESTEIIRGILDKEHAAKGIPYSKMMLAGFSQGGAMSLFTGLQLPQEKRLAGILVMSGYLAGQSKFKLSEGVKDTPVLHCHGTSDPMVKYEWAEKSQAAIKEMGATNYELKTFAGMEHTVWPEELGVALEFIRSSLSAGGSSDTQAATPSKSVDEMSVGELKAAIEKAGLGNQAVGLLEKKDFVDLLQKNREEL